MLQQTQVKTVIPYFLKFIKQIPNLKALSENNEKKVLKLWEGLGYYRRAINLHKTAKILIKNYKGKLPSNFEEIKKLPGVGEYTANALLALIYDHPHVAVDGNVKRVFSRLFNKDAKKYLEGLNRNSNKIHNINRNADFAEALMEFGSMVCKPQKPLCSICNLKKNCKFFKNEISFYKKKKKFLKERKYNIYCYLNKPRKEIALTTNKNLSFLSNFKMPKTQAVAPKEKSEKRGWKYLCNYKNNISNIKMNINLYYKFTNNKPSDFIWHPLRRSRHEFIPSFTKKIFNKVARLYV